MVSLKFFQTRPLPNLTAALMRSARLSARVEPGVPGPELVWRLGVGGIGDDAVDGADLYTLRRVVGAHALRASQGVDDEEVDRFVTTDRFIRALGLAGRAVDATFEDLHRHRFLPAESADAFAQPCVQEPSHPPGDAAPCRPQTPASTASGILRSRGT